MNIEGIILAAGCSERAGVFKTAFDIAGKPLLIRSIESMREICDSIIVVGGCRFGKIEKLLKTMPKILLVRNDDYKKGMFSSVQMGVRMLKGHDFFLLPGDQPLVKAESFNAMAEQQAEIVLPRYHGKKGHPVLFRASCIPEILAMPDTEILRNYIHAKTNVRILDVEDPAVLMDADTPEDLETIARYFEERQQKEGAPS